MYEYGELSSEKKGSPQYEYTNDDGNDHNDGNDIDKCIDRRWTKVTKYKMVFEI